MKVTLSSTELSAKLQTLSKTLSNKNAIAILDSFVFNVKGNALAIKGGDTDTTMFVAMATTEHDAEGVFSIDAKTIVGAVSSLPEQPITIEVGENNAVTLHYSNGAYKFSATDHSQYPKLNKPSEGKTLTFDTQVFADAVGKALSAVAINDELRAILCYVHINATKDYTDIVGTDGHKLIRNRITSVKTEEPFSINIPSKVCKLIKATKAEGELTIKCNANMAEITLSGCTIITRLLEGKYPNYNNVIPTNNDKTLTINKDTFISSLKRVGKFSGCSSRIALSLTNGKISIKGKDIDYGNSAEEALVCDYSSEDLKIGFKNTILIDILSVIKDEDITLRFSDASRACVATPKTQADGVEITTLCMPMLLD